MINLSYMLKRKALQGYEILPLFYVLPKPLIYVRKWDSFPRNPFTVITTPKWQKLCNTIGWRAEVADLWALTVWPSLGIRGGISNYSTNDPFIRLVYHTPLWAALLAALGVSLDSLAMMPDDAEIQYFSEKQTDFMCDGLAKLFWHDPTIKAKQILEIVQEHRAHDDFADRKSTVRIDFHRRYYHTRTKSTIISIDEAREETEYIPANDHDMYNVVANDWVEKFYGWLGNKKDIDICKLLYLGCTQEQIAERLGYKNHSGINKRIKLIREIFEVFVKWQQDLEEDANAPPPEKLLKKNGPLYQTKDKPEPCGIRYDVIEFSYKRKNIVESEISGTI